MSAPTASPVRAFSQFGRPQLPIEEYESNGEAVHRKRGRSLSTPPLNTREWHQFRMLDATTPHLGPCEPMPLGRSRSALFNPSPVITCVGPSLGDQGYGQLGCLQDHFDITKPNWQVTAEKRVRDQGSEHQIKRTTSNARPLPLAGVTPESLLKRRNAPRSFFSLAELNAISSFGDFLDDGHFSSFEVPLDPFTLIAISSMPNTPGSDTKHELGLSYFKAHSR